jgi:EDD domain protein, DegV family
MTAFFFDTDCELWLDKTKELGLKNIILMPYTLKGKEYFYDLGENYDAKEFFKLMREGETPITSALNPEDYKNYFEPFYKKGEDIFYVSFSSEMSGTFKYMDAAIAELAKKYPKVKFTRYDTKAISMGGGILVYAAALAYNEGKSVEEIIALLDSLRDLTNVFIVVDDLKYLKRGGRLSAVQAAIGGILNIKPIIKLTKEGKLAALGKVQGRNKALATIADETIASAAMYDKYPITVLNADCEEDGKRVADKIRAALPGAVVREAEIGPVIGAHCGPGTVGICFIGKERPEK